jgi:nitrile hydratase subunit beta
MDGIHDLGGRQGFGPIDVNEPEEPFHQDWEARALGIIRSFTKPVPWSLDWFRHVRELIEPTDYLTRPYYDQWLQSYEAMLIDSGLATVEEVATGRSRQKVSGLPPPASPESVAMAKTVANFSNRKTGQVAAFAVGAEVRTKSAGSSGHTRLPQYARGRIGRVEVQRGNHVLADTNLGEEGPAEPLYTVSFAATDLWPDAKGPGDRVMIDLWESYLERH